MKRKIGSKAAWLALTVVVTALFVIPILWMLSSSLKDNNSIFKSPPDLLPSPALWQNYPETVAYIPFFKYLKNTVVITLLSAVGIVVSTPCVAYGFAKLKWPGRQFAFFVVLSTMMLPFQVQVMPLYVTYKSMGWLDTILPLVVPNFFSGAIYIFLMRQFMLGIPDQILEAARIDGAGHFRILFKIAIPFCKPVLFAIGLFTVMANWTDFFGPLVFLTNENNYTLSLGLQQFSSLHKTQWNYLMAACTLFTIPPLVLFFCAQKYFLKGITFSGVKE